jgi:hypothetical protein
MCPVCLATAAIIAAKVTGTGSLTAFVATTFRKKKLDNKIPTPISIPITEKEDRDGHEYD